MGSEILAFDSHCSANFQPILDCFIPIYKLKYDDLENIETDRVNVVVFNLLQIRQSKFFFGTPGKTTKVKCYHILPISRKCDMTCHTESSGAMV